MSRGEQINTVDPETDNPQTFNIPIGEASLPGGFGLNLHVSQCVEGGWIVEHENGSTFDIDGTFDYTVELQFDSQAKVDELLARDDAEEIRNTMINTLTELSEDMLKWERGWDTDPDAYIDGVIPDNPEKSFSEFAIEGFNEDILPDFVNIMNASYPELGLSGAVINPDTGRDSPGCYQGGPENLAEAEQQQKVATDPVVSDTAKIMKM